MRYGKNEDTTLVGKLAPGGEVHIRVLRLSRDALVELTSDVCNESVIIPGTYLWHTSNITDVKEDMDCMYEMTDGTQVFYGKFTYGGRVDEVEGIVNTARDVIVARVAQVEEDVLYKDVR